MYNGSETDVTRTWQASRQQVDATAANAAARGGHM